MGETVFNSAAAKAFSALENSSIISRSISHTSKIEQLEANNHIQLLENASNSFWLKNPYATEYSAHPDDIIFPQALHFDLALNTAQKILKTLSHFTVDKDTKESVKGMDKESRRFFIETMTKNLTGWINKRYTDAKINLCDEQESSESSEKLKYIEEILVPVLELKLTANKGIINAQQVSGLDETKIRIAFFPQAKGTLARKQRKYIETIALHSKLIGRNARSKCSAYAHGNYEDRQKAVDEWMKNNVVTNGKIKLSLAEIGKSKKKQAAEMYQMAKGIQKVAENAKLEWASIVCTLIPAQHPNPIMGKDSWNGTTPDQGNKIISENFALVRAILAKKGITLAGLWTREAHGDATPHVNFLVYFPAGSAETVKQAFEMHFHHGKNNPNLSKKLQEVSGMKWRMGNNSNGKKGKKGDGSFAFASYAFKYFAKFLKENPSKDAIEEAAWASSWGIRRYAFLGLPSMQIWRRMRATRTPINDPLLEELRLVCRSGNAAKYIELCGGLSVKRNKRPFRTIRDAVAKTVVGVECIKSGFMHINKIIGEWSINKGTVENIVIEKPITFRVDVHYAPQKHELGKYGAKDKYVEVDMVLTKSANGKTKFKQITKDIRTSVTTTNQVVTDVLNYSSKTETSKLETDFKKLPIIFTPNTKITTEKEVEKHKEEQKYIQIEAKLWQERRRITLNSHYLH